MLWRGVVKLSRRKEKQGERFVCLVLSVRMSLCVCVCVCACMSVSVAVDMAVYVCVCICICLCVHACVYHRAEGLKRWRD